MRVYSAPQQAMKTRCRLEEVKYRDENDESSGTRLVSCLCGCAILRLPILLSMVWILRLAILDQIRLAE